MKSDDHSSQRDTHKDAREPESYLVDLGIYVASLGLASMALDFADRPAIESHDLCSSLDCIQPIEQHTLLLIEIAYRSVDMTLGLSKVPALVSILSSMMLMTLTALE